eukprot:GHRR01031727.1.p1 GENE.GHRR01031727.1~~GHRR01031727.1.p1  ORF type:complete len:121 (-),score=22.26 GHRR01031727.1:221-583(-)
MPSPPQRGARERELREARDQLRDQLGGALMPDASCSVLLVGIQVCTMATVASCHVACAVLSSQYAANMQCCLAFTGIVLFAPMNLLSQLATMLMLLRGLPVPFCQLQHLVLLQSFRLLFL